MFSNYKIVYITDEFIQNFFSQMCNNNVNGWDSSCLNIIKNTSDIISLIYEYIFTEDNVWYILEYNCSSKSYYRIPQISNLCFMGDFEHTLHFNINGETLSVDDKAYWPRVFIGFTDFQARPIPLSESSPTCKLYFGNKNTVDKYLNVYENYKVINYHNYGMSSGIFSNMLNSV